MIKEKVRFKYPLKVSGTNLSFEDCEESYFSHRKTNSTGLLQSSTDIKLEFISNSNFVK